LPGYSGSPVFVYEDRLDWVIDQEDPEFSTFDYDPMYYLRLLGLDWSHLYDIAHVRWPGGVEIDEGWVVRQNSGMMGVIPAWRILALLENEHVAKERTEAESKWRSGRRP
jgi:hypothetical protein